ncbi:MAG: hypothetical protein IJT94_12740 [Oscillibacter sp.]|nr:hypothetical protein [Oscillibacter sp.]
MIRVTIEVDAPEYMAQGVKEQLAMDLERFGAGNSRVVSVDSLPDRAEQLRFPMTGRNHYVG